MYPVKKFWIRIKDIKEVSFLFANFHVPDIASLPAGLFSTPTKLSWCHACIYPLPADLFSIQAGLQELPTALILFFLYRYIAERGDAENLDILTYFLTSSIFLFFLF
jgi:hypothetical protein